MKFLKALYRAWMKFAHALGWLNTRSCLLFILLYLPPALIFRLLGKDPMERRFEAVDSYWIKREAREFMQKITGGSSEHLAKIRTVHRRTNRLFYDTIHEFNRLTGCPVIVNTSFNVRGEPMFCTP